MSLKDRISSPLEAGTSILDAQHLPPCIIPALDYASSKLAKKSLHLTLVVARRDYQLCSSVPPSPGAYTPATPNSPFSKFAFASASVSALRQLVHRGSSASLASQQSFYSPSPSGSAVSSPGFAPYPPPSAGLESPRWRIPQTPLTPMSMPPMTPSSLASDGNFASSYSAAGAFTMRLIHASHLCPKTEKIFKATLARAEAKFHLAKGSLGIVTNPQACGLSSQLYNSSVIQNEVLYAADGLQLLDLDRHYSLKSALSLYTKTRSPLRLEDAVDELRRLVLARNGAQIPKSDLLRCYDWLSIDHSAIGDLDQMYRRAYGGPGETGGIQGLQSFRDRAFREPMIRFGDDIESEFEEDDDDDQDTTTRLDIAIRLMRPPKPPSPRGPALKLETNFIVKPASEKSQPEKKGEDVEGEGEEEEEEDGDLTARPADESAIHKVKPIWNTNHYSNNEGNSIDEFLNADALSPRRTTASSSSLKLGPMTPNGYDDISPVTRGEWGFMMVDNALSGRRGGVETF